MRLCLQGTSGSCQKCPWVAAISSEENWIHTHIDRTKFIKRSTGPGPNPHESLLIQMINCELIHRDVLDNSRSGDSPVSKLRRKRDSIERKIK